MKSRHFATLAFIGSILFHPSANAQTLETSGKLQAGGLSTSSLETSSAQPATLPLSLPDARPVAHPAAAYLNTMYKKEIYQQAVLDRYRVLRGLTEK